jgi:hypothetical protein
MLTVASCLCMSRKRNWIPVHKAEFLPSISKQTSHRFESVQYYFMTNAAPTIETFSQTLMFCEIFHQFAPCRLIPSSFTRIRYVMPIKKKAKLHIQSRLESPGNDFPFISRKKSKFWLHHVRGQHLTTQQMNFLFRENISALCFVSLKKFLNGWWFIPSVQRSLSIIVRTFEMRRFAITQKSKFSEKKKNCRKIRTWRKFCMFDKITTN